MSAWRGKTVNYVSGNGVALAFVQHVREGGNVDLTYIDPETNALNGAQDVPQRDPADYGPEGGGHTYHNIPHR